MKIAKILRTAFFAEQLQWLLLTFKLYFQRSPERKPVRLSAINTRFTWNKSFSVAKISSTSVREIIPEFFYPWRYGFVVWHVQDVFIIKKLLNNVKFKWDVIKWDVIISASLGLLAKVWVWYRCQNRIEKYYYHDGEQVSFYQEVLHIKTQAEKRIMFL